MGLWDSLKTGANMAFDALEGQIEKKLKEASDDQLRSMLDKMQREGKSTKYVEAEMRRRGIL